MTPYVALVLFVTCAAYAGRVANSTPVRRGSIAVVMLALIGFAGFRDYHVGTDTGNYVRMFAGSTSFSSVTEGANEIGYNLLAWSARSLSDEYVVLLLMIAVIVVCCYVPTITRLTRRYETALFLFVALGTYTFFFNGARQGIAAAICFWALPFVLERRVLPYLLAVGVAYLFHKTALIALPLYFLAAPRIGMKRLVMMAAGTALLIVFLRIFVGFAAEMLDDKYAQYAEAGEGGGAVWTAFLFGQGVLLYGLKGTVREQKDIYARLLNIYMVGVAIAITSVVSSVNPSGLLRLHQYFSSTAILMWPMVFLQFRSVPLRGLVAFGFLCVTMLLFLLTTSTFSDLTPYRLNPEISLW